ncbi:MAG: carbohydrate ABC transporter permease [Beutenbergiaceae bacterium]
MASLQKEERSARRIFVAPFITFLIVISVFPTAFGLIMSFTNFRLGSGAEVAFVGISNYADLLSDSDVVAAITRTLLLVAVALPIQLALGLLAAKILFRVRDLPGAGALRTIYLLPVMLPEIVVALLFAYMLDPRIGIGNYLLSELGLPRVDWFATAGVAFTSITLIVIWQWVPLAGILFFGGLLGIPPETREAAAVDGAGSFRTLTGIELPMLRRIIGLIALLVGVQLVGTFPAVYMTTQGGPGTATRLVALELYRRGFVFFNTGSASALAIVTLIVVIVLSQVLVRFVFKEDK